MVEGSRQEIPLDSEQRISPVQRYDRGNRAIATAAWEHRLKRHLRGFPHLKLREDHSLVKE